MAPLTARTVENDSAYMLLYYCLKSTNAKPDFKQVANMMGLSSAEAASHRLMRLTKVQDDVDAAATAAVSPTITAAAEISAVATPTVSKKAAASKKPATPKKLATPKRSAKGEEGNGSDVDNSVRRAPKKRKDTEIKAVEVKDDRTSEGDTIKEDSDAKFEA